MGPGNSTKHAPNGGGMNSEFSRDLALKATSLPKRSDLTNELVGQTGIAVRLTDLISSAERRESSTLGGHVRKILRLRTEPQMLGTHTRRIVAAVANVSARWYWANGKLVGDAVGFPLNPGRDRHYAVPPAVARPLPLPTVARSVYATPEPFSIHR